LLRSHVSFKGGRRDSLVFGLLPDELRVPEARVLRCGHRHVGSRMLHMPLTSSD